jgi:branched-chain amino acid transport system ATP-binding protein
MTILQIERLTVRFGGLLAVDNLEFSVRTHSIHSLIGPNGAGKTTVINTITGLYPASQGSIRLDGTELLGARPERIARAGIGRTFQNAELFAEMTVLENVLVGAQSGAGYGLVAAMLKTPRFWREQRAAVRQASSLIEAIGLGGERDRPAAALPLGKQRLLELARALAAKPKLILLDEPAAGLRAAEIDDLNRTLVDLRDRHSLTILLVDHVMQLVMTISDRVTVLNFGRKIADGSADSIRVDPEVRRAYLGDKPDRARAS